MYRLPGMSLRAGSVLLDMLQDALTDWDLGQGRPKSLSVADAVRMTLMRLRRNVTFAELGEDFGLALLHGVGLLPRDHRHAS